MSGHSKWHNIQKTKGAADAKRSAAFTKIAKDNSRHDRHDINFSLTLDFERLVIYNIVYIRETFRRDKVVTRKEDTPQRVANRKYEEKNKQKRQAASGNFQTMIPRDLFDEINAFLKERNMSKVDFIKKAYELMKNIQ